MFTTSLKLSLEEALEMKEGGSGILEEVINGRNRYKFIFLSACARGWISK